MRILKVSQTYAPFLEYGGPPVKVRALAEGLARRRHQVTVLTADWGIAARNEFAPIEATPFGFRRVENQVETFYLPSRLRFRTVTWNPGVKRFCRERLGDYDLAHIYGLYDLLGPAIAKACRLRGIPYIVEPIGMFRPIVRSIWRKRMYHLIWGQRLVANAARVIATSGQEVEELEAGGVLRGKILLRRNGVELPEGLLPSGRFAEKWKLPARAKRILFLGRLVKKKSPELLLEALALVRTRNPALDACAIFAGPDGGDGSLERLRTLASRPELSGRVYLVGPLYGQDKWAAYRDADVFVLPSQNENFGNTAAEAVAAGTPVIVTDTCGIAPLLAGRAGLVVPHDAEALARALERLLASDTLRAQLAEGCAQVAPQLGWEEPVAQMESLYEELLTANRRQTPTDPPAA
jgi:glycosyltransferase involved in cell wall biosynthesis